MKMERQLAIITYLLNRDIVTCKHLAEKFEVTERTIQRDIDSINMAGIPIVSLRGTNGGYQILDTYKLSKQTGGKKDLEVLKTALESLNSALDNKVVEQTLEKVKNLEVSEISTVSVDFSVVKENERVQEMLTRIEKSIEDKLQIEFNYTNAYGSGGSRCVEPIGLQFKWYRWYMVGYCLEKQDYRIFKLVRMEELKVTNHLIMNTHQSASILFDQLMEEDKRKTSKVSFRFKSEIRSAVMEYLNPEVITKENDGFYKGMLSIVEDERKWFAFLLSFGEDVEIIDPPHIRERIIRHSKKIIDKYEIPDT